MLSALRRRFNSIRLQYVGNRSAPYLVPYIGQRTLNPRVSPLRILQRHAHDQIRDLAHDSRATWPTTLAVVSFLRHQASVPAHQGIRSYDGFQLSRAFRPTALTFRARSARSTSVNQMREPRRRSFSNRFSACRYSMAI